MAVYTTITTPLQLSPSPRLISSHLHSFPSLHTSSHHQFPAIHISRSRNARNARVGVRARGGYTKRPMDMPDAYELVDEESGEKLIVLGDDVDHDSASVLWRKSGENVARNGGTQPTSSVEDNISSTAITQRSAGSFGRLKVQKVRSLIKKSEKQVTNGNKYEELDINETNDDDDEYDHMETSDSEDGFIGGKRNVNVKTGIDQLVDDQPSRKSFDSVGNSSKAKFVSNASATRSNGWNSGEGKFSSRGEKRDLKDTRRYPANSDFFSRKTFKDLPCSDDIVDSLRAQGFVRPSHIQAMAYVPAVEGKSCIVADQSGSGKTLAYLAPVIQRLRQEEIKGISKSAPNSPRAVVIVPTAELASQVLRNCRSISKNGVPFRSMVATGGFRQRTQLESLDQDLDVLIATPGRFMYLIKEGFLRLTNLRCAVLDEVDVLFKDEDFEQALQSLITSSPVTTQYLFATATLPVGIYNKLIEIFPDCKVIMGPGMHRTSSGLEEILVDCSGKAESEKTPETAFSNKRSALLKLAGESPVPKTIVFCNKIETCRKVENALRRFDRKENQIRVLPFHAALDQDARLANMKEFITSDTHNRSLFLICTDRASRGIDFPNVDHVVLFDFPRDPSEYVRRVGRTARGAGGRGRAFVFVVGKQVSLASRIIDRNQKGHPLHEVPSAYELLR